VTLTVESPYVVAEGEGEALWFSGALLTYKTTGDQTGGRLAIAEVLAPEGTGSPKHLHLHEDEAWSVIDGELTFFLGETQQFAGPGSFVFGPRRVEHRFEVTSPIARFVILVTPAGFEDFTRVCGHPATSPTMPPPNLPPKDLQLLTDAARLHGLEIHGFQPSWSLGTRPDVPRALVDEGLPQYV
jgi:mannose-6-phosphate isomerase-like protein (cupin superfamily)